MWRICVSIILGGVLSGDGWDGDQSMWVGGWVSWIDT
jgi:hypothetical protein